VQNGNRGKRANLKEERAKSAAAAVYKSVLAGMTGTVKVPRTAGGAIEILEEVSKGATEGGPPTEERAKAAAAAVYKSVLAGQTGIVRVPRKVRLGVTEVVKETPKGATKGATKGAPKGAPPKEHPKGAPKATKGRE